jgi:hypothetical protein
VSHYQQGYYTPQNPEKILGDIRRIVYRSSWELKLFRRLDSDPNIEKWGAERIAIPYTDKGSGKLRRYYPDLIVKKKDGKVLLIEVKPAEQSRPPTSEGKSKRRYLQECKTWATNFSKWETATRYAKERGWEFKVFTERELGIPTKYPKGRK